MTDWEGFEGYDIALEQLDRIWPPWAENYDEWTDELTPVNTTDPSVPLLAAILSNDNSTNIPQGGWDVFQSCYLLNDYLDDGQLHNSYLQSSFNERGPQLIVQCLSYSNVTRAIERGLAETAPRLTAAFARLNVTGNKASVKLAQTTAYNIAQVMNADCTKISCGRKSHGTHGGHDGEVETKKVSKACELERLLVNGTHGGHNTLAFEPVLQCRQDLCDRAKIQLKPDPDIGGAGVFLSYLIQIAICIVIGLYIVFKYLRGLFQKRRLKFNPDADQIRAISTHPAFERVLYLFTRVQAWFVVSLIIAGAIRNYQHSVSDVDQYLLLTIALNGIVLISFTLLASHELSNKHSPTTLVLSAAAFIASVIFYVVFVRERRDTLENLRNAAWYCTADELGSSGKFSSIFIFFFRVNEIPNFVFWIALSFCIMIEVFVIIFECFPRLRAEWKRQAKWLRATIYLGVSVIYLGILVINFFMLMSYFKVTDWREWGFGQIMALLFWMPIIYDYVSERLFDPESSAGGARASETLYSDSLKDASIIKCESSMGGR